MRWKDGREERERGVKGQQVFLFICCSISVIDLVFFHQPPGLPITHTHARAHTHTQLVNDCDTQSE